MVLATIRQLEARDAYIVLSRLSWLARKPPERPRDTSRFYVTELLYCPLRSYLDRVDPSPPPLESAILMEIGRHIHELVARAAIDAGFQAEVPVEHSCGTATITGRADIVAPDAVVEVKTVAETPSRPHDEHALQAWFYAEVLGKRLAQILYISRLGGDAVAYPAEPPAEGAAATLCRRALLLKTALESGQEPGCIPGPWCRTCPYRQRCPCW